MSSNSRPGILIRSAALNQVGVPERESPHSGSKGQGLVGLSFNNANRPLIEGRYVSLEG